MKAPPTSNKRSTSSLFIVLALNEVLLPFSSQLAWVSSPPNKISLWPERRDVQRQECWSKPACGHCPCAVLPSNTLWVRKWQQLLPVGGRWHGSTGATKAWFLVDSQKLKAMIASALSEQLQVSLTQSFGSCFNKGIPRHCSHLSWHQSWYSFQRDRFFLISS